jgi:hypothetical protein
MQKAPRNPNISPKQNFTETKLRYKNLVRQSFGEIYLFHCYVLKLFKLYEITKGLVRINSCADSYQGAYIAEFRFSFLQNSLAKMGLGKRNEETLFRGSYHRLGFHKNN